jgi:hypothetical protein
MTHFNIGDTAYHAHAGLEHIWITCPECLGSGRLRVILGDESEVSIACVCCERGYEGSPGKIRTCAFQAAAQTVIVAGIDSHITPEGTNTVYKFGDGYYSEQNNLFATLDGALARAAVLAQEHQAEEAKRLKYKENQQKTWAWHVSHWRREIRLAKETIARCEARLAMAPKNSKEADKLETPEAL